MRRLSLATLAALVALSGYAGPPEPAPDNPPPITIHKDAAGKPFLIATGLYDTRQAEILAGLSIRSGERPAHAQTTRENKAHSDFQMVETSPLYWRDETGVLDLDSLATVPPARKSTTWSIDVLGHRASVTASFAEKNSNGVLKRFHDSYGGQRIEKFPLVASDQYGPILAYRGDGIGGRIDRIFIGQRYVLEMIYPKSDDPLERAVWSEKRLRSRADGQLLGAWTWRKLPPPRPGARLWSTGSEPQLMAEWDAELYPEGAAVLSAHQFPYMIIPKNPQREVYRSISLPPAASNGDFKQGGSSDRLDYNAKEFRLWVSVGGPQELNLNRGFGMLYSVLVILPRQNIDLKNSGNQEEGGNR